MKHDEQRQAERARLWDFLANADEEQLDFVEYVKALRNNAPTPNHVVAWLSHVILALPEAEMQRLGRDFVCSVVAGGFSGDLWRYPNNPARVM